MVFTLKNNTSTNLLLSVFFGILLFSYKGAQASDIPDYYAEPGVNPFRDHHAGEMHESIDPFGGGLTLNFTDIVVPQNGGLDVVVQRTYRSLQGQAGVFGYPYMPGRTAGGVGWDVHFGRIWYSGGFTSDASPAGCKTGATNSSTNPVLELPDGSRQVLIDSNSDAYAFITKERWIGKCRKLVDGGGLEVTSPTGIKYIFNDADKGIEGTRIVWVVSRVEDPNGNYIKYVYNNTQQHMLIKYIYTKESPTIPVVSFTYDEETGYGARLRTVTSYTSTWTYNYKQVVDNGLVWVNYYYLVSVSPPAGNNWQFTYNENSSTNNAGLYSLSTITTPGGTTTSYTYDYMQFDSTYSIKTSSVTRKEVSGGGVTGGAWIYSYTPSDSLVNDHTVVSGPEGRIEYFHFGSRQAATGSVWKVGTLWQKDYYDTNDVLVQRENYSWEAGNQIADQNEAHRRGGPSDLYTYTPHLASKTITRDGTAYTTTFSNYDDYGNPKTVTEQNGTNQKVTTYVYDIKSDVSAVPWIIHLMKSETVVGISPAPLVDRTYDGNGNLMKEIRNGVTTGYAYNSTGEVSKATYPKIQVSATAQIASTTDYTSFKAGTATMEVRGSNTPNNDAVTIKRSVNSDGTVASETVDGKTTGYSYDGLSRLAGSPAIITPATNDADINIIWTPENTQRTLIRGNYRELTTFDGLGRRTFIWADNANDASARSVQKKYTYDALGRLIFESYPQYADDNGGLNQQGETYKYDVLNRVIRQTHADDTFVIYKYLPNNQVRVTNERGVANLYSYRSYGDPDQRWLIQVTAAETKPESIVTTIERDALGNIQSVTQGGVTKQYYYNSRLQLVGVAEPEIGPGGSDSGEVFGRDEAGNLTYRYTSGDVSTLATGAAPAAASGITHYLYDYLSRPKYINYADNATPDVSYSYYPTGKIKDLTKMDAVNGNLTWHYDYSPNDILIAETLTCSACPTSDNTPMTFKFQYYPNEKDAIQAMEYPNGLMLYLYPDYLGRSQAIVSPSHLSKNGQKTEFAKAVNYYPNGVLDSIIYGNSLATAIVLDNRLRTTNIQTGAINTDNTVIPEIVSLDYGYDANGNITSITDDIDASRGFPDQNGTPGLGYDAIDRLTQIQGNSVFAYDAVNNITKMDLMPFNGTRLDYNYDISRNGLRLSSIDTTAVGSTKQIGYFAYQYDTNGNVTNNNINQFVYNEASHLTQIDNGSIAKYYDGNGRLVIEKKNGKQIYTLYDSKGRLMYEQYDQGDLLRRDYIRIGSLLVAQHDDCDVTSTIDTDQDGIPDCVEFLNDLDPNNPADALLDKDGDGLSNVYEYTIDVTQGNLYRTDISNPDTDNDGIPDGYEVNNGLNPKDNTGVNGANGDLDHDGVTNIEEYNRGMNANNSDTDGDGMQDGWEVQYGLNPLANDSAADPDGDNISNLIEFQLKTNPNNIDTDGDFMSDGAEYYSALDPLRPSNFTNNISATNLYSMNINLWAGNWRTIHTGDFNGDGKTDLLLQGVSNSDGTILLYGTATGFSNYIDVTNAYGMTINHWASQYRTVHTGDFNGDGKTDLLLQGVRNTDGTILLYGTATGFSNYIDVTNAYGMTINHWASQYRAVHTGDFNGDGKTDLLLQGVSNSDGTILLYGTATGFSNYIDVTNAYGMTINHWASQYRAVHVGDFNGDGKTDLLLQGVSNSDGTILLYGTATGFGNYIDVTNAYGMTINHWASQYRTVNTGDFNGDGKADLLLQGVRNTDGTILLYGTATGFSNNIDLTNAYSMTINHWASQYRAVHTGDFNGDGTTDLLLQGVSNTDGSILLYGTTTGFSNYIDITNAYGMTINHWARIFRNLNLGDFNGDGKTDLLLAGVNSLNNSFLLNGQWILPNPGWYISVINLLLY